MADDLLDTLKCAERAQTLARDLDKVRGPGDLRQVAAGIRLELDCVVQRLSDALDARRAAAVGDRTGKVRNDALRTSQDAASLVVRPGTQRAEILLALFRFGDQTDFELQERLGMAASSERPRRGELVDGHFVDPAIWPSSPERTGGAITRKHQGRDWQVWKLTLDGLAVAEELTGEKGSPVAVDAPQSLF